MNPTERILMSVAKALAYFIVWMTALVVIFRFGVNSLWGSMSDMGMIGAVGVAVLGILFLAYLALVMVRDLRRGFQSSDQKDTQP